jgi:hypothetical protein
MFMFPPNSVDPEKARGPVAAELLSSTCIVWQSCVGVLPEIPVPHRLIVGESLMALIGT